MRAAGLLPLLLLPLLLGVNSQDDADSISMTTATTTAETTTETTTGITPAATTETSTAISTTSTSKEITTIATTTKERATQATVAAPTTGQSPTTASDPGKTPSPTTMSPIMVAATTPTTSGSKLPASTATTGTSGQDSSSHSTRAPTTALAPSPTTSQQPSSAIASPGNLGTTTAVNPIPANATSPPGAVGAAGTSSPSTQPQGNPPNTTVSAAAPGTDPSQSSKECVVPPPTCPINQTSSSSSPAQGPAPSSSPGSTNTSVTPPVGSPSLATTKTPPMSQPGSNDTVSEAPTTTAHGADQSTQDGSVSDKRPSASQSPDSAHPPAPSPGDHTDLTGSCSPGLPHRKVSVQNEFICEDQVQLTKPTIHLKEAKTCDQWRADSSDISFFESFCSTAQRAFDAGRDGCTVKLMACKPHSHDWAVHVVLHLPLDSEEVLKELKEDKLEKLGIVNITSGKMVEDMTITDEFSTPLIITIITLAVSLLLIAAIYGCYQRFSHKKDQNIHPDVPGFDDGHVALIFNRLTEEMQTMENGYHDNPTLEVMETSSEMQEKKVNLNGELGDSWIVPLDTLMKEDLEEEEDTHL